MTATLPDLLDRPLRDLRVSVTDRCNFRCTYCMPKEVFGRDYRFLPHPQILTFEEIARVVRIGVGLGVRKVRITGGEPLLRRDLPDLVAMLRRIEGIEDLTLTTNGSALAKLAPALKAAGLDRVTVSLDSLHEEAFRAMNDVSVPVARVLEGIAGARAAGLGPLKVNMVVKRGVNECCITDMAGHFRGSDVVLRFIEYMDVGTTNGWRMADVVPAREILERVAAKWPIEPLDPNYRGEVARRYRYVDGAGEIGVIASVTAPFCGGCRRARLSSDGRLFTCLFASEGADLRAVLRGGGTDEEIAAFLRGVWTRRDDRYSEIRTSETDGRGRVEMSRIGG